ncbi:MAG: SIR2 family protein [Paludibacteraceae bacterium]|nr:SIR2 family protein [Paludibacteraceae bacterium]
MNTTIFSKSYWKLKRRQRKQIVILLGAGAAIPWNGISSDSIKNCFIENNKYEINGKTLGKYIFEILDNYYDPNKSNFETFLATLESILNYKLSLTTEGKNIQNTSFSPSIYDLKNLINDLFDKKDDDQSRAYIYEIYTHYLNVVIDKIYEYDIQINDKKHTELNKNLIDFIKYYLSKGYSVKFYTTNYDSLVTQSISKKIPIYNGIVKYNDIEWLFDKNLEHYKLAKLSYINLHGAIYNGYKYDMGFGKYINIRKPEYYSQQLYAIGAQGGNPNEMLLYSPIITGYNKSQRAFSEPLNISFNAFANDCNDCVGIITVGYSFSDPHINSIISTLTSWNKCKFLHITIADTDNNIDKNEFSRLNEVANFINKEADENEFWMKDANERKFIYKKGFDEFLKNKSNWRIILPGNYNIQY